MAITVYEDQVTEFTPYSLIGEASALGLAPGLAPGQWPEFIETPMGNGRSFELVKYINNASGFVGVRYRQIWGRLELDVLND